MISVKRDGNTVKIMAEIPKLGKGAFPFSFTCGSEWSAMALETILHDTLAERIKKVRTEEYNAGFTDAKKRVPVNERRDFFLGDLDINVKK